MVIVAALATAVGLGLRWLTASGSVTGSWSEGTVGLGTARSIAEGDMTWFVADGTGPASGALGALVLGGLIRLFGEGTAVVAMATGIGILAAVLIVLVVRRRLAGPWPFVAAATWSSGSAAWITSGSDPADPIVITTLLGLGLVTLADRGDAPLWWALGFVLGLGWWTSPLIVVAAAPAIAMLAWRRVLPTASGYVQLGVGATIGALPRLIDEVRSGMPTLRSLVAWPDDPGHHLRTRPLATIGAALGLSDGGGRWLLPAGGWVAAALTTVLALTVVTVLARQPRSRSALLLGIPAMVLVDLTGDGWGLPAHAPAILLGPAMAIAVVIALSAAPARARPSAAIIVIIAATLLGTAGILLDGRGDAQTDVTDARTASSAVLNAAVE
jgi:hypothetical protein